MDNCRKFKGQWISTGMSPGNAPCFRKSFFYSQKIEKAILFLCGLGYHVLYVNGVKADDRVLAPAPTQFDKHVSYIEYDITTLLHQGENTVAVLLGNGLYFSSVEDTWNFAHAPWKDVPKLICDIKINGEIRVVSDNSWRWHNSHITFNALRNGQYSDARLKISDFAKNGIDETSWHNACTILPPGGMLIRETQPPCRITHIYKPVKKIFISAYETTYDFGVNLTGWCRIRAKGKSGDRFQVKYGEQIASVSGRLNTQEISGHVKSGIFQCDQYTLGGSGEEICEPDFAYHGFRYVQIFSVDQVEIIDIEACFIHTDFEETGNFNSSDEMLNTLQRNTLQSFLSNYTGIPTDCPHREKNGWTGDAQLAAATGLWNFDTAESFRHFLQIVADTQRPDGQLPGTAPNAGWGYNRLNGPAWDSLIFEYPCMLYLFKGDTDTVKKYYDNCRRYLDYCLSMAQDYLLDFGLGDWCHWDVNAITDIKVTSSGYFYQDAERMALFARILGRPQDAADYENLARKIKESFNRNFAHPDGIWADGTLTAQASVLYFGLAEEKDIQLTADILASEVKAHKYHADFGILGAKFIPRMLAEYGYADDAFKLITQTEFPGWGYQVIQGATTLWENWNGTESQNHIMFGDISAWMYQYPGGIIPTLDNPGFRHFILKPCFITALDYVDVSHKSEYGIIHSSWQRNGKNIHCHFEIPSECTADIILPDKKFMGVSNSIETDI